MAPSLIVQTQVMELITKFYTRKMQAPQPELSSKVQEGSTHEQKRSKQSTNPHAKRRQPAPADVNSRYPFEASGSVDSFQLEPAAPLTCTRT